MPSKLVPPAQTSDTRIWNKLTITYKDRDGERTVIGSWIVAVRSAALVAHLVSKSPHDLRLPVAAYVAVATKCCQYVLVA